MFIRNMIKVFVTFLLCFSRFNMFGMAEPLKEKPIAILIASYNNAEWYEKNLLSVFAQKYDNYRVIYIDDCSTDETYNLVTQIIQERGQKHRVQVLHNETNKGAMYNLYIAGHMCADNEIIVTLDGDDWFPHADVLARVNRAYQNPDVWLTYGQYQTWPGGHKGHCRAIPQWVIDQNAYREYSWESSHLRTYYAWLFKKIKIKDFLYKNDFFPATYDQALMYPMLEMAAGRWEFIDENLYIYNMKNPLNDFKIRRGIQAECDRFIRSMNRYEPLESAPDL